MSRCTFTVFTPTYNRAHTLHRVWESLAAQTFRDFEWLVCDDGSTDGTAALVARFAHEAPFPVRYLRQENQGKHVAFNHGVREAHGELFLTLDSDDRCVAEALERLKLHWDSIPAGDRPGFSAVSALCVDEHGRLVGDRFPFDPTDSDSLEIRYRFRVRGDKWGFHRTDVLREHPYPVRADARHIPPGFVWRAIARRYRTRYVNEALCIAHRHASAGRLSAPATRMRHAKGLAFAYAFYLSHDLDWCRVDPMAFVRYAIQYVRFTLHARAGVAAAVAALERPAARALAVLAVPAGVAAYGLDRVRARRTRPAITHETDLPATDAR